MYMVHDNNLIQAGKVHILYGVCALFSNLK